MKAFCTSKLAVFQNPSNSSFLVASDTLSKQRLVQRHETRDARLGVTYQQKRTHFITPQRITVNNNTTCSSEMAVTVFLVVSDTYLCPVLRRCFLTFFFQVLLRLVRFRERFGGELGRGVETRLEDLLSCPELPFSELQVLGEGPDGLGERLVSLSAILQSRTPRGCLYAPSGPFWRTRLRKRACGKILLRCA